MKGMVDSDVKRYSSDSQSGVPRLWDAPENCI